MSSRLQQEIQAGEHVRVSLQVVVLAVCDPVEQFLEQVALAR